MAHYQVCVFSLLFGDSCQHRYSRLSLFPAVSKDTAVLGCCGPDGCSPGSTPGLVSHLQGRSVGLGSAPGLNP